MSTSLKYRIENCKEQAIRIKAEYPSINFVAFKIEECSIAELQQIAQECGKEIKIFLGHGEINIHSDSASILLKTKRLIINKTFEEA